MRQIRGYTVKKTLRLVSIPALVLALSSLGGCGSDTPEILLASAKSYVSKGEPRPAIIQLKNLLQVRPESAEARFLLGQALLASDDPGSALVELRKARELKHPDHLIAPSMARAMVMLGQYKAVTEQFGTAQMPEPAERADLKTSLAISYLSQGEKVLGTAALQEALNEAPNHIPALIIKTRTLASERKFDSAFELIDKMVAISPDNHEVWNLKGDLLLHAKADSAGALQAHRKALTLRKDFLPAHAAIILIQLAGKQREGAASQLAELKKLLPQHPQTKFLEAQVAFERADYKTARELTLVLLKFAPEDPKLLMFAGSIELSNLSFVRAETYLQKALQLSPASRQSRLLLAQTYIHLGQPAKALAVSATLLESGKGDGPAMAVAAQAYLLQGDVQKAEALYAEAAKLDPADVKSHTALAMTHISLGNVDAGFGELQRIASSDPGSTADLALIGAHLIRKNFAAALAGIDALERKEPNKPLTYQLRGAAHLGLKQTAEARKSFERALSLDPAFFAAVQSLAAMDIEETKPALARKRFEDLLAIQPSNLNALLAVASIRARSGDRPEEVAKLLLEAVRLHPGEAAPRLRLIETYIADKKLPVALVTAQDAVATIPNSAELLDALGRVQAMSGDSNQAQASFNKLAALQPNSPQAHMRIAELHLMSKNGGAALQSLYRALAIKPDLLVAQRNAISLELSAGRVPAALLLAKAVQAQRPSEVVGYLFEGDVEVTRRDFNAAAAAYRKGLKVNPRATPLTIKLHAALMASGKHSEADGVAASWLKVSPQDVALLNYLGLAALERQHMDEAERLFSEVVRLQPDNVIALNNLAWTLAKLNKPEALPHAKKVNELKPNDPALMDTLAAALAADNQLSKALEIQKKVVTLQPKNYDFRLNLAKLYIRAGDNSLAKSELSTLSSVGEKYRGQSEVARILKTL